MSNLDGVQYVGPYPYKLYTAPSGYTQKRYGQILKCKGCGDQFFTPEKDTKGYCSKSCAQIGKPSKNWRGGKYTNITGYIWVHNPQHPYAGKEGYIKEHRLVMEKHIGRYLKPEESVHHKNRDRKDNRIENLELFATESLHQKYERNKGKTYI